MTGLSTALPALSSPTSLQPALPGYVPGGESLLSAVAQEVVNHRSVPWPMLLFPTLFTPRTGSALSITFRGGTRGWLRHPKSGWHPRCRLLRVSQDKVLCLTAAAREITAYKYSCLLKATSLGCILK